MITLGDWLARAPFGLAMSSGFFSFFAHTGMLSALVARGLRPIHVAGSSAGAMVAGAWAAGLEPDELGAVLGELRREDFWDPAPGVGLLAGKKFDGLLRGMLPTTSMRACRVPLRISVFDIFARRTTVLEDGDLATAIRASCAVPAMFHPVWIGGRPYWDGGILDRPGIAGVPPGRLLFHHISNRSPWRVASPTSLAIPTRTDMVALVVDGLPRSHPWRLDAGRQALLEARAATERALDMPVREGIVRVHCNLAA
ncbi:MAG: patatin-like phospholipase family protein [Kofleriaceae bacterium]|nr:patatin-like phospholipase family protein [Kofleriaceae bacterium]